MLDWINILDGYGYDCYVQQNGFVLRATGKGCWAEPFGAKEWGNYICVLRSEEALAAALDSFSVASEVRRTSSSPPASGSQ